MWVAHSSTELGDDTIAFSSPRALSCLGLHGLPCLSLGLVLFFPFLFLFVFFSSWQEGLLLVSSSHWSIFPSSSSKVCIFPPFATHPWGRKKDEGRKGKALVLAFWPRHWSIFPAAAFLFLLFLLLLLFSRGSRGCTNTRTALVVLGHAFSVVDMGSKVQHLSPLLLSAQ
jgi:hypothetical protein